MSVLHLRTTRLVAGLTVALLLVQFYVTVRVIYVNPSLLVHNQRPSQLISCLEPLILLDDGGRMGNQFFEYLEAKLLGEQLNRTVFIRQALSEKFKKYFTGIDNPVFGSFDQVDQLCNNTNRVEIHMTGLVKIDPSKATKPHVKLTTGYPDFIPPKLWKILFSRREELLRDFQWRPELQQAVREHLRQLTVNHTANATLIGVHVRMQDYHAHMKAYYGPSKLPGRQFFNESMNYYRQKFENPLFLVVSNDMQWCRNVLTDDDVIFGGNGNETDPGWDLALLTHCDHLIMTYGSYGVMAAYLMGGEVVAADNFTTKANTFSENIRGADWPEWHWINVE